MMVEKMNNEVHWSAEATWQEEIWYRGLCQRPLFLARCLS